MNAGEEITIEDAVELARFVAQLIREGVRFEVATYPKHYIVTLTGGF